MVNTFIDSALKNLDLQEENCSLASPLKDQILNLKQKSRFLKTNLIYRQISASASTSIISTIDLEAASRNATAELSIILVPGMKKTIQILKETLSFLRNLAGTNLKRSIVYPGIGAFLSHVHVSATNAACLSYMCWDTQLDEIMACKVDAKLSDLLQNIKPFTSDLMETFSGLVKASILVRSESAERDEIQITRFINFLLENSVESMKDRIDSIYDDLGYLIAFLVDLPDECLGDLEQISTDINAVAEEVALFRINDVKEEQTQEMNIDISRFFQR